MAKEVKKQELKEEETKELEKENLEKQETEEEVKELPAEVEGEKKGFHPVKFVVGKVTEFGEKHPKVVSGAKTVGKVAIGAGIGVIGTVAVLASVAKGQMEDESNDDTNSDDNFEDDIVDSTATEVESDNSEE